MTYFDQSGENTGSTLPEISRRSAVRRSISPPLYPRLSSKSRTNNFDESGENMKSFIDRVGSPNTRSIFHGARSTHNAIPLPAISDNSSAERSVNRTRAPWTGKASLPYRLL